MMAFPLRLGGKESWMRKYQSTPGTMAVGLGSRVEDEEARAEVEVLNSRLDKTSQLTKRIQASLNRLEASGQSLGDAIKPLSVKTQTLQTQGRNIDNILNAIERVRQPSDIKNDEQQTIQRGPEAIGIPRYLDTVKRIGMALADLQRTNLRSNQQAMSNLSSLLQKGNAQLEKQYDLELRKEPDRIEVLRYTMNNEPMPPMDPRIRDNLRAIGAHLARTRPPGQGESPTVRMYTKVRGDFLVNSLHNSSLSCLDAAKKKPTGQIYNAGDNPIGMYALAVQYMFAAEYDNITALFPKDQWGNILNLTCQGAISELSRTIRELSSTIRANMSTDCYFAYEIIDVMKQVTEKLKSRTDDLKPALSAAVKPARDAGKSSIMEFQDETRRKVQALTGLPIDGAHVDLTAQTMARLQKMADYISPLSSIMLSIGDKGWKPSTQASGSSNSIPSLNSFDPTKSGETIFANYCFDIVELLLTGLDQRARAVLKKHVQGVFIANNAIIVQRMIIGTSLEDHLEPRKPEIRRFEKIGIANYCAPWNEAAKIVFDQQKSSSKVRPPSGSGVGGGVNESAAIVKAMSSKDKDSIKEKFKQFNAAFDDLVAKHNALSLDPELNQLCVKQMRDVIERLYGRFYDRYHEIDKGKGKHVKYDKEGIARVFAMMEGSR